MTSWYQAFNNPLERHSLIRLIANNDLRLQRIGGSRRCRAAFRCFVRGKHDSLAWWVHVYYCSFNLRPPTSDVLHTRERAEETKRRSTRQTAKEGCKKGEFEERESETFATRWRKTTVIRSLFLAFRVKSCIIIGVITSSPPPTSLLMDNMTESYLSLLRFFVSPLLLYCLANCNWQNHRVRDIVPQLLIEYAIDGS